jgi:dephospho-CoA kinase
MTRVGLTGGIASGKTTVSQFLGAKGCTIIDADTVAHQLLIPGQPGYEPVVRAFGRSILTADGRIDRVKLGTLVFSSSPLLEQLNGIIHPEVIRVILTRLEELEKDGSARIIVDASLMIESGFYQSFQRLILVTCSLQQQIERLVARTGLSEQQALERIRLQMPLDEKRQFATDIVDNSGSLEQTRQYSQALFENLERTAWITSH